MNRRGDPLAGLHAELLAERFGPRPRRAAPRTPVEVAEQRAQRPLTELERAANRRALLAALPVDDHDEPAPVTAPVTAALTVVPAAEAAGDAAEEVEVA